MDNRRTHGTETWARLREWSAGQTAAERLAARTLQTEGVSGLDPSHPLGGPDGRKDAVCLRRGARWIVSVYFPTGQKRFADIKGKLTHDAQGIERNGAKGIIFVTNQELTLAQRRDLTEVVAPCGIELYHLERLALLLDAPSCYGLRQEFLALDMTREEQLSFFASHEQLLASMREGMRKMEEVLVDSSHPPDPERRKAEGDHTAQLVQFATLLRSAVDAFFRVRNDRITRIQFFSLFMKWERREGVFEVRFGPSAFPGECFLEPEEQFLMILEDEIVAVGKLGDVLVRLQTQYDRFLDDEVLEHYLNIQFWFSLFRDLSDEVLHNSRRAYDVVLRQIQDACSSDEKAEMIEGFVRGQAQVKELYWEREVGTIDGFCQLYNRFIRVLPESVVSEAGLEAIDREQLMRMLEKDVGIADDTDRPPIE